MLDQTVIAGEFGLIDSFGVLHHLEDPLAGLKVLESHLVQGGILRVMLYSRYARRREESIRRALRLLGVTSSDAARSLLKRAPAGSRLARYLAVSDEATNVSGLADALLHPRVHTYRIDELLEMLAQTDLELLMFAHPDALADPADEIARLRDLEKECCSPGNFVFYLRRKCGVQSDITNCERMIMLNPCLVPAVSRFKFGTLHIISRIGVRNPPLTCRDRSFLRQFIAPVRWSTLFDDEKKRVAIYKSLLFMVEC
jgi:hypothetical protein